MIEQEIEDFAKRVKPDFDPFASTTQTFTEEIELGETILKIEVSIDLERNRHEETINGASYVVSDFLEITDVEYIYELFDIQSKKTIFEGESRYLDLIIDEYIDL